MRPSHGAVPTRSAPSVENCIRLDTNAKGVFGHGNEFEVIPVWSIDCAIVAIMAAIRGKAGFDERDYVITG